MRLLILILVLSSLLTGCTKTLDENPIINTDYTLGLTGTYSVSYYQQGSQEMNLPDGTTAGVIEVTRVDFTHILAKLTITQAGQTTVNSTNTYELKPYATKMSFFYAYIDGQQVGTMTTNVVNLKTISADGTTTQIKAGR